MLDRPGKCAFHSTRERKLDYKNVRLSYRPSPFSTANITVSLRWLLSEKAPAHLENHSYV
jgi:hypothetical protein